MQHLKIINIYLVYTYVRTKILGENITFRCCKKFDKPKGSLVKIEKLLAELEYDSR